jgi:hypothetical protein
LLPWFVLRAPSARCDRTGDQVLGRTEILLCETPCPAVVDATRRSQQVRQHIGNGCC